MRSNISVIEYLVFSDLEVDMYICGIYSIQVLLKVHSLLISHWYMKYTLSPLSVVIFMNKIHMKKHFYKFLTLDNDISFWNVNIKQSLVNDRILLLMISVNKGK